MNLDSDGLKLASSIGLDVAIQLKDAVSIALKTSDELIWSGWPQYPDILAVVQIICEQKSARDFGAYTEKQLAFLINKLRKSQSHKAFLIDYGKNYKGKMEDYDSIFKFLRACEYGIPQYFAVIELFVRQISIDVDYSLFIGGLNSWFCPDCLKELDEEGIPIQISERFYLDGDTRISLKERLRDASETGHPDLTAFERQWIMEAV